MQKSLTGIAPSLIGRTQGAEIRTYTPQLSDAGERALARGTKSLLGGIGAAASYFGGKAREEDEVFYASRLADLKGSVQKRLNDEVFSQTGEYANRSEENFRSIVQQESEKFGESISRSYRDRWNLDVKELGNALAPRVMGFQREQVRQARLVSQQRLSLQNLQIYSDTGDADALDSARKQYPEMFATKFGSVVTDEAYDRFLTDIGDGELTLADGRKVKVTPENREMYVAPMREKNIAFNEFVRDQDGKLAMGRFKTYVDNGDIESANNYLENVRDGSAGFLVAPDVLAQMDRVLGNEAVGIWVDNQVEKIYADHAGLGASPTGEYNDEALSADRAFTDMQTDLERRAAAGDNYAKKLIPVVKHRHQAFRDMLKSAGEVNLEIFRRKTTGKLYADIRNITGGKMTVTPEVMKKLDDYEQSLFKAGVDSDGSPEDVMRHKMFQEIRRDIHVEKTPDAARGASGKPSVSEAAADEAEFLTGIIASAYDRYMSEGMEKAYGEFVEDLSTGKMYKDKEMNQAVLSKLKTRVEALRKSRAENLRRDTDSEMVKIRSQQLLHVSRRPELRLYLSGIQDPVLRDSVAKLAAADIQAQDEKLSKTPEWKKAWSATVQTLECDMVRGHKVALRANGAELEFDLSKEGDLKRYLGFFPSDMASQALEYMKTRRTDKDTVAGVFAERMNEILRLDKDDAFTYQHVLALYPEGPAKIEEIAKQYPKVDFSGDAGKKLIGEWADSLLRQEAMMDGTFFGKNAVSKAEWFARARRDRLSVDTSRYSFREFQNLYLTDDQLVDRGRTERYLMGDAKAYTREEDIALGQELTGTVQWKEGGYYEPLDRSIRKAHRENEEREVRRAREAAERSRAGRPGVRQRMTPEEERRADLLRFYRNLGY